MTALILYFLNVDFNKSPFAILPKIRGPHLTEDLLPVDKLSITIGSCPSADKYLQV